MGTSKFDELTRSLATSTSRRQAIGALFAGALGGILGASGIGRALAATCSPKGAACQHNSTCCSGDCYQGKCGCKPKGANCNYNKECCSGSCQTFAVAPNWYCA